MARAGKTNGREIDTTDATEESGTAGIDAPRYRGAMARSVILGMNDSTKDPREALIVSGRTAMNDPNAGRHETPTVIDRTETNGSIAKGREVGSTVMTGGKADTGDVTMGTRDATIGTDT